MEPPEADQITAVLPVPATLAVNCWVAPTWRETEVGLMETFVFRPGVFDRNAVASATRLELPALTTEHPVSTRAKNKDREKTARAKYRSRKIRIKIRHFRGAICTLFGQGLFLKITEVGVYTAGQDLQLTSVALDQSNNISWDWCCPAGSNLFAARSCDDVPKAVADAEPEGVHSMKISETIVRLILSPKSTKVSDGQSWSGSFAGDDFWRGLDQKAKYLEGLVLQGNALTGLTQFSAAEVHFELVEARAAAGWTGSHCCSSD
jgi:hypothetical protein